MKLAVLLLLLHHKDVNQPEACQVCGCRRWDCWKNVYDDCARQQQFSRRIHPDRVSYQLEVASESDSLNKCSDVCVCTRILT